MRITANHAHLMPPREWSGGQNWPEGDADMLLRHLDFCGIERVVIFPPFACQVHGSMKEANLWALREVRAHADRLIPAGTVFPLAPDIIEMLAILAGEGVRLAKVHPSIDLHDVADARAGECYAKAAELGIALDWHTGVHGSRMSFSLPTKYDDIAWDHPGLTMVFEHLGGRTFFEQFMAILGNHRGGRVFGGLTSVLAESHKMWYLGPEKVVQLVECVGSDKLIFGLDFPWNSPERTKRDIEIILGLDIPEAAKEQILGGNLRKLVAA